MYKRQSESDADNLTGTENDWPLNDQPVGDTSDGGAMHDNDGACCEESRSREEEDLELDAMSDVSENSDIFHAEVVETPKDVETREDLEFRLSRQLSAHFTAYPLLPADPRRPSESFMEVDSCVKVPTLHCAFKGCTWAHNCDMKVHWSMESLCYPNTSMVQLGLALLRLFRLPPTASCMKALAQ